MFLLKKILAALILPPTSLLLLAMLGRPAQGTGEPGRPCWAFGWRAGGRDSAMV